MNKSLPAMILGGVEQKTERFGGKKLQKLVQNRTNLSVHWYDVYISDGSGDDAGEEGADSDDGHDDDGEDEEEEDSEDDEDDDDAADDDDDDAAAAVADDDDDDDDDSGGNDDDIYVYIHIYIYIYIYICREAGIFIYCGSSSRPLEQILLS